MSKRGRKPNNNRKGYFYEEEEEAVLRYIQATTKSEKDFIFETYLKTPFTIMIESIIRRYNLYSPNEVFEETFCDTMSFLITKLDKYNQMKGKAFSYLQTICKNYLLYKIGKNQINQERTTPYDEVIVENINQMAFEENSDHEIYNEIINETISTIQQQFIENDNKSPKDKTKLNENEIRIGVCLIELLMTWEYIFQESGCDKFNKNSILTFIKDRTGMNTKEIRDSMKKFKVMYFITKEEIIK